MSADKTNIDIGRTELQLTKYDVDRVLPEYFQSDYPKLIALMKYYFEYLEEESNPVNNLTDLLSLRDIVQVREELLSFIGEEVLLSSSYFENFTDKRTSIEFSNLLYRSKGTKYSIEQFFRIFFDIDAIVEYPKKDIFYVSDVQRELLEFVSIGENTGNNFPYQQEGDMLVQLTSNTGNTLTLREDFDYSKNTSKKVVSILKDPGTTDEYLQGDSDFVFLINQGYPREGNILSLDTARESSSLIGSDLQQKRIQDNKLYQLFSLLITTPFSKDIWGDAYGKFAHPAGMYFASKVIVLSSTELGIQTPIVAVDDTEPFLGVTYSLTPTSININEGSLATFTVQTNNFQGTLYWSIDGSLDDFDAIEGTVSIQNDTGTFNISAIADNLTEGTENYNVTLRVCSADGPIVEESTLTVVDTSSTVYALTSEAASVNEGSSVLFTATTTGIEETLYWTINGTTGDFDSVSGSITISSGSGDFSITALADNLTEGTENYTVSLRTGSTSGTVVDTLALAVNDTSVASSYTLSSAAPSVDEGSSVLFTATATDFSGTLYWTIDGTTADFDSVSGSFVVSGNTGTFTITALADNLTEGTENYTVSLRTGSTSGTVVDTLGLAVNDTSLDPVYTLSSLSSSINEGDNLLFTAETTGAEGTLYWTINGTTADFTTISGSIPISSGSGTFNISAIADNLTEGTENYTVSLRTGSTSGTVVDTLALAVIDTSVTPDPEFDMTPTSVTINEGSTQTFTVTAASFPGSTLYWRIDSLTAPDDFVATSGSITLTSGTGTFDVTTIADSLTEGNELYSVSLRTGSTSGTVVRNSSITINDTSVTPPTYSLTPISTSVNEGSSVTFTANTTNFLGSTLYWSVNGTTADFTATSGSIPISGQTGTFNISAIADSLTEGAESYTVSLRTGSTSGTVVDTSLLEISDTSTSVPTYSLTPTSTSVNEGSSAGFTVNTTNFVGSTLYWSVNGTTADFTATSGSIPISGQSGSFSVSAIADSLTEGTENYTVSLRTGSTSGTVVDTSSLTVNDTSVTPTTYSLTPSSGYVVEGEAVTFTVNTTNFLGSTLYWNIAGVTTTADFSTINGSISISGQSGTFNINPVIDGLAEGNEIYTINLRTGSINGTIVDTSSLTVDEFRLTPSVQDTEEPSTVNFVAYVPDIFTDPSEPYGTRVYWTIDGTTDDFTSVSGNALVSGGSAGFSITVKDDNLTEGEEVFTVSLRTGSTSGTVRDTTQLTVEDTSITPTPSLGVNSTVQDEGDPFVFTFTAGTITDTYYWWIDYNVGFNPADDNDFVQTVPKINSRQSFSVSSGTGTFFINTVDDGPTNEPEQYFRVFVSEEINTAAIVSINLLTIRGFA